MDSRPAATWSAARPHLILPQGLRYSAGEWQRFRPELLQVPPRDRPTLVFRSDDGETTRYFPDKLPIAVHTDDQTHVFVYLATKDVPVDFRSFLERHAELFRSLSAWRVRVLIPLHLRD